MAKDSKQYAYYDPSHPYLKTLSLKKNNSKKSLRKIVIRTILLFGFFIFEGLMMFAIADSQIAYSPVRNEVVTGVKPPKQVVRQEKVIEKPPVLALSDQYLVIPKLYINAPIDPLGVTASGEMATSPSLQRIAWYKDGTKPGIIGSAVFAGHYGGPQEIGIFRSLDRLVAGDVVEVRSKDGKSTKFIVYKSATYEVKDVPLQDLFNKKDSSYLNLVTCVGNWNNQTSTYDKRLVVYAKKQ